MEKLEKYILENRDELDRAEYVDHAKMWTRISQKTGGNASAPAASRHLLRRWKWVAVAASVAALLGWGLYFSGPSETTVALAELSPEMAEREATLQRTISKKELELGLDTLDRARYAEVFGELAELEKNAELTRQDVANGLPNERALETLLRQYELKIRILENLSREIEIQKHHEKLEKEI